MVGLGMPGASRLSSIWAGRCAEEKTTTQRARSPSGDQFMVLALSLPVKKQISWCVCKRPATEKHKEDTFSLSALLLSTLLISLQLFCSFYSTFTHFPFLGSVVKRANVLCLFKHRYTVTLETHTHMHAVTYIC